MISRYFVGFSYTTQDPNHYSFSLLLLFDIYMSRQFIWEMCLLPAYV